MSLIALLMFPLIAHAAAPAAPATAAPATATAPAAPPATAPVPGAFAFEGEVLLRVNGQPITEGMLEAWLARLPANTQEAIRSGAQLQPMLQSMVTGEALYQEALARGLHERADVRAAIALAERDALMGALVETIVAERTTPDAVRSWYESHPDMFQTPQAHARHILVKTKAEARSVLAVLAAGGDFPALAAARSLDPGSREDGGDLGWFEQGRMVPEFAEAVFGADTGAVLGPVKTKFGYHVIEVLGRRDVIPLEDATQKIASLMRTEIVGGYLAEVEAAAKVTEGKEAP
jgi:peptidyl-prolyl cis-trans isomerase C